MSDEIESDKGIPCNQGGPGSLKGKGEFPAGPRCLLFLCNFFSAAYDKNRKKDGARIISMGKHMSC